MSTLFSAAPQALGYLHQTIRYSLHVMMESLGRQDRYLRIEKLDDIEIVDGDTPYNSIQVKQTSTNLTDRSMDFWKTIRVWSENLREGKLKLPDTILTIATTAKASEYSIASLLRRENRQPEKALQMMLKEIKEVTSSLEVEFSAFASLHSEQQKSLVNSIEIYDCAPDIEEVVEKIKARFYAVHPENRDKVFAELEDWWFLQVVSHLRGKSETKLKVSSVELKLAEINDNIKPKTIQYPFLDEKVPADYDSDRRTFVLQLRLINLPAQLREIAIRDFYNASKLRKWLVDELHLKELTTYDQKLKDEWAHRFYANEIPQDSLTDDAFQQQMGRKIYDQIITNVNVPIHRDFTEIQNTRGSYQILADMRDNLEIGWHPNFKEAIKKLLLDEN